MSRPHAPHSSPQMLKSLFKTKADTAFSPDFSPSRVDSIDVTKSRMARKHSAAVPRVPSIHEIRDGETAGGRVGSKTSLSSMQQQLAAEGAFSDSPRFGRVPSDRMKPVRQVAALPDDSPRTPKPTAAFKSSVSGSPRKLGGLKTSDSLKGPSAVDSPTASASPKKAVRFWQGK